jgi:hypothetical protein
MAEGPLSVRDARAVLGVTASATRAQVVSAFRRRAKAVHPDVSHLSGAAARFAALVSAYPVALRAAGELGDQPVETGTGVRGAQSEQRVRPIVLEGGWLPGAVAVWEADRPVLLVGPVTRHRSHPGQRRRAVALRE